MLNVKKKKKFQKPFRGLPGISEGLKNRKKNSFPKKFSNQFVYKVNFIITYRNEFYIKLIKHLENYVLKETMYISFLLQYLYNYNNTLKIYSKSTRLVQV